MENSLLLQMCLASRYRGCLLTKLLQQTPTPDAPRGTCIAGRYHRLRQAQSSSSLLMTAVLCKAAQLLVVGDHAVSCRWPLCCDPAHMHTH